MHNYIISLRKRSNKNGITVVANTYDQGTGQAGEDTYCEMLGRSGHDQETNNCNESTENELYVSKQGEETYCEMLGSSGHDQETNNCNESTENEFYVSKEEAPVYATVDRCSKVIL